MRIECALNERSMCSADRPLVSVPPQYKRFTWRKSQSVPVAEIPSKFLGIVPLCGTTVDF